MTITTRHHSYAFKAYLELEEASNVKHEFHAGEIYAMAAGTIAHAELALAVASSLREQLRGSCRVFSSDLRIRVSATGLATYPDATVICGPIERDPESSETVTNPTLLVEVLSDSTEAYDRGQKFEHYQQISGLEAVLFVSQDRPLLELRQRCDAWETTAASEGETLQLSTPDCCLDVDEIDDGVL